ncbi:MAG: beta-ketoacyl-ACP synthase 3 [Jatrophihabitantaceae bacterium]
MTTVRPARLLSECATSTTIGGRILGVGAAQPAGSTSGAEVAARFGRTGEWIETRTGIRNLRLISGEERLIDLARTSTDAAILASGVAADRIDLIIATSCTSRPGAEALGPQIAEYLGIGCPSFDLNAACSGFCYAVSTADSMIRTGSVQHVLIVSAEHMSDLIDPGDLGTAIIFGDGAGAAVVGPGVAGELGIGPVVWGSDGEQAPLIAFGDDDTDEFMRMQGRQVFRWAVESIPDIAVQACTRAGVLPADIEVFVPHQANLRIIDAVVRKVGLDHTVVATDIVESGNTSSASIPIALTRLRDSGAAKSGQLALLVGFGAGLAFAAQVVRLP